MNVDSIASSVIKSAVKKHLSHELKRHCERTAKLRATAFLKKNQKAIETAIDVELTKTFAEQKDAAIKKAAAGIKIKAPTHSRYY